MLDHLNKGPRPLLVQPWPASWLELSGTAVSHLSALSGCIMVSDLLCTGLTLQHEQHKPHGCPLDLWLEAIYMQSPKRSSYPSPYSAPPSMHTPQLPCFWGVASWPTLIHSWSMNGVHSLTQQMSIGPHSALCLRYWRHHRIRQTLFLPVQETLEVVKQVIEFQRFKGTEGRQHRKRDSTYSGGLEDAFLGQRL